jgi:hypothetical protein
MSQLSLWMVLTTIAVLIGPTNGFARSAKDYDIWQVASSGGTPSSSIHTRRTRAADGSEYLTQESRILIDVLGQRQEMSESSECRATAAFFPQSYHYQLRSLSGDSTGEGRVEGNEFVLVLRRGAMTLERRASLADKPILAEQVIDFLATKSEVSGPFELAVLQGDSCTVKRAKATRHPEANGRTRWTPSTSSPITFRNICRKKAQWLPRRSPVRKFSSAEKENVPSSQPCWRRWAAPPASPLAWHSACDWPPAIGWDTCGARCGSASGFLWTPRLMKSAGSPALLKITHGDTVEGTQRARWAMSESLDVTLVSVEKSAAAAPGLTTGIVGQTYIKRRPSVPTYGA